LLRRQPLSEVFFFANGRKDREYYFLRREPGRGWGLQGTRSNVRVFESINLFSVVVQPRSRCVQGAVNYNHQLHPRVGIGMEKENEGSNSGK
jgi:hypothetical protein